MRVLTKRLTALEAARGFTGGWDHSKPCHAILMDAAQPYVEALADYRAKNPERVINPDDKVMWIQLVSPDGREPETTGGKQVDEGPSLADVLAMEAGQ